MSLPNPFRYEQDVFKGQFLTEILQVCIQGFPFFFLDFFYICCLNKSTVYPTI